MVDYNKRNTWVLNLKIPLDVWGEDKSVDKNELGRLIQEELTYWDEGRYTFQTEQIKHALSDVIKASINTCIQQYFYKLYPNEMVPHNNGSTARFLIEAEKLGNVVDISVDEQIEVNIV